MRGADTVSDVGRLVIWRHPRPEGAVGRCIGQTDLPVDPRRAKRLAHHIRRRARRQGWPAEIWTSPLRRSADVGRWLRRWGWHHRIDPLLQEMDFGAWDGRFWSDLTAEDFARWDADFVNHAPGGGESVQQLRARVCAVLQGRPGGQTRLAVGHAGWINALLTLDKPDLQPAQWPRPVAYMQCVDLQSPTMGVKPGRA